MLRLSNRTLEQEVFLCTKIFHKLERSQFERIIRWSKQAQLYKQVRTKFSFYTHLFDSLWSIPEAIEEGFRAYMLREQKEYEEASAYHDKNCEEECIICLDRKVIKEHLGDVYERKEP